LSQKTPESFEPSETIESALDRACKIFGIEREYCDIWGTHHAASAEVLAAILTSLGVNPASKESIDAAVEERLWNEWSSLISPTIVTAVRAIHVEIHVPEDLSRATVEVEFAWEDGEITRTINALSELAVEARMTLRGRNFVRKALRMPALVSLGYHRVHVRLRTDWEAAREASARLIICPDRAYTPESADPNPKAAGIAVSLYGLRSPRNWGCGDFTDLRPLVDWAVQEAGASFISLNPLHAIANRQPYNTSPYLPQCSFYRNPLYLDIEKVEDFALTPVAASLLAGPKVQQRLAGLRDAEYVEYEKVWAVKFKFLKLLFRNFLREYRKETPRALEFRKYLQREGEVLDRFAVYCALDETIHKENRNIWIWPDWPEDYRDPNSPAVRLFVRAHWRLILFYKWMQWQVDLQLSEAQQYAREQGLPIGLYHDLALATDRCGCDLWAFREFYVTGCRVGSPPDGFSPKGQDWAFPPPNTVKHRADGYEWFARSIRQNLKHGGALRIDHVMRFFRLYWIPDGVDATQGTYVRDCWRDLLHILALESVRNHVIIVGEDLGTVEPAVREALQQFNILSYRLLYFEKHQSGDFKAPQEYPYRALVSVSTHDLPTLAGFWTNRDIEARRGAGLLPDDESYRQQLSTRTWEKQKLLDSFVHLGLVPADYPRDAVAIPEFTGELHAAAVGFLARTPSELMVLNQEDLFKETDQQNLPGSTWQYPNWRHKMRLRVDELRTAKDAIDCTAMFRWWMKKTGRFNAG
jgi:4-alpha-glucanotransferase